MNHALKIKNFDMGDRAKSRSALWIIRLNRLSSNLDELNELRLRFKHLYSSNFSGAKANNVSENTVNVKDNDDFELTKNGSNKDLLFSNGNDRMVENFAPQIRVSLPTQIDQSLNAKGRGRGCLRKLVSRIILTTDNERSAQEILEML